MNKDERELAENCYGYGRWDAPYWFIGLEEGQAPWEGNKFDKRAGVFRDLQTDGLCDCCEFHSGIGEHRFHEVNPKLQSTWKYLMLLITAFQQAPTDDEDYLKGYQRERWGRKNVQIGETCVIELSGLPANNSKIVRPEEMRRELERIRPIRINNIQHMLQLNTPKFVVMYGTTKKEDFRKIAGLPTLQPCIPAKAKAGSTTFLLTKQPAARYAGQKKTPYWIDLGAKVHAEVDHS